MPTDDQAGEPADVLAYALDGMDDIDREHWRELVSLIGEREAWRQVLLLGLSRTLTDVRDRVAEGDEV